MELAVFAARIDIARQVAEELLIEVASGKLPRQLGRIDADQLGPQTSADPSDLGGLCGHYRTRSNGLRLGRPL